MTQEEFHTALIRELEELNDTMLDLEFAFYAAICGEFGRYPEITNALLQGYTNSEGKIL